MRNRPRPRPRRHSATDVIRPSTRGSPPPLSISPSTLRTDRAITEPSQLPTLELVGIPEHEIQPEAPRPINSPQPQDLDLERGQPRKKGFLARRLSKLRNGPHHPSTEQAHRKSLRGTLKAILLSSWVNVLLVFVPVVSILLFTIIYRWELLYILQRCTRPLSLSLIALP